MSFTVDALYLHPLKSGRAQAVDVLAFDDRGPLGDRRYVVVDEAGRFLTQREWPGLGAIGATAIAGGVRLTHAGAGTIDARGDPARRQPVRVWADTIEALDCGDAVAAWLGALAGRPLRLAYQDDAARRPLRRIPSREVSLADGYPVLVVSRAAIDALSARLGAAVVAERFRPNVVVAGCPPHAEDGWTRIRVGQQTLRLVKPCERCSIPALDPATGATTAGFNRALAAYRRVGGQIYFGMNAVHEGRFDIRVGDEVEVIERA